ncbi:MAG: hypothetical protein Cons2KO_31950 [Congregibacter sp.]
MLATLAGPQTFGLPPVLAALGGFVTKRNKAALFGASMSVLCGIACYCTMPAFAGGAIVVGLFGAILALVCAGAGAPKTSAVAMYYCISATVPFWVSRESTFDFEQGYLWLEPAGLVFAAVLFLLGRRHACAT